MTLATTTACCLVGEGLIGVLLDGGIGRLVVHLDYEADRCVDGDPLVWGGAAAIFHLLGPTNSCAGFPSRPGREYLLLRASV